MANQGRKPGIELEKDQKKIPLQDWALEILENIQAVCDVLDQGQDDKLYTKALQVQRQRVLNPELTPSARMLDAMKNVEEPFDCLALAKSAEHAACFNGKKADETFTKQFNQMAQQSLAKQAELENKPQLHFDEFLKQYFAQQ